MVLAPHWLPGQHAWPGPPHVWHEPPTHARPAPVQRLPGQHAAPAMRPQFAGTHWPMRQALPVPQGVLSGTFMDTQAGWPKESQVSEPLTHGPMPASQGPVAMHVPPPEPPPTVEPPPVPEPPPIAEPPASPPALEPPPVPDVPPPVPEVPPPVPEVPPPAPASVSAGG
jgi:hypothetical protein